MLSSKRFPNPIAIFSSFFCYTLGVHLHCCIAKGAGVSFDEYVIPLLIVFCGLLVKFFFGGRRNTRKNIVEKDAKGVRVEWALCSILNLLAAITITVISILIVEYQSWPQGLSILG